MPDYIRRILGQALNRKRWTAVWCCMVGVVCLAGALPGQTATPLAQLLSEVRSQDIFGQLNAADTLGKEGELAVPEVRASMMDAIHEDVAARWDVKKAGDSYVDALGRLIVIAAKEYGFEDPQFTRDVLRSNVFFPQTDLGYQLSDQGARILPEVLSALHDEHSANRANALGVLANMLAEEKRGRTLAPLPRRARQRALAEIYAAARAGNPEDSGLAIWALSRIRDSGSIAALTQIAEEYPDPRPYRLRDLAYQAIAVIRFCEDDPPDTSAQLGPFLERMAAPGWTTRARAFYSLMQGASDPYYGPRSQLVLRHFPSDADRIRTSLIRLLTSEDERVHASRALSTDPLYLVFFGHVVQSVAELKDPAALDALIGALGFTRMAPDYVSNGGVQAVPKLIAMLDSADAAQRRVVGGAIGDALRAAQYRRSRSGGDEADRGSHDAGATRPGREDPVHGCEFAARRTRPGDATPN